MRSEPVICYRPDTRCHVDESINLCSMRTQVFPAAEEKRTGRTVYQTITPRSYISTGRSGRKRVQPGLVEKREKRRGNIINTPPIILVGGGGVRRRSNENVSRLILCEIPRWIRELCRTPEDIRDIDYSRETARVNRLNSAPGGRYLRQVRAS